MCCRSRPMCSASALLCRMVGTRDFFFRLDWFYISSQAIGRTIKPRFTTIVVDLVGCIVGTGAGARIADIVGAYHARRKIATPDIIVLRVGCTTPVVQAVGKGAADADNNGQGHQGPFYSFHTKLFLFLVIIIELKCFLR